MTRVGRFWRRSSGSGSGIDTTSAKIMAAAASCRLIGRRSASERDREAGSAERARQMPHPNAAVCIHDFYSLPAASAKTPVLSLPLTVNASFQRPEEP